MAPPVLIKQVFDILVSLYSAAERSVAAKFWLSVYFYLLYTEHRKYYTKISWEGKS